MNSKLIDFLFNSKTAYHAVSNAENYLLEKGFKRLDENSHWNLERGSKYYVVRDGSALIAFCVGKNNSFNIVASHADSPCFKIKFNPEMKTENYIKLNTEKYGGGIMYSWFDSPLTIAGRVILSDGNKIESKVFTSANTFVIPSVAIHFNRSVNDGIKINPQVDMCPIVGLNCTGSLDAELNEFACGKQILDSDLYVVSAMQPFYCGYNNSMLSSPRIDNLTSAFASIESIADCSSPATSMAYIADNEEVGSSTKQGAGSTFLIDVISRINYALGLSDEDLHISLSNSFMVSCDNAHAVHPNHPELSDPTNKTIMGEGIVIKHHANQNYTTDGVSSSIIKQIFSSANAKYQDFFMKSDLPCGGTLGAISSRQVSIRSVDIGLAQLAMHSCVETFCPSDYDELIRGLKKFYSVSFEADGACSIKII